MYGDVYGMVVRMYGMVVDGNENGCPNVYVGGTVLWPRVMVERICDREWWWKMAGWPSVMVEMVVEMVRSGRWWPRG